MEERVRERGRRGEREIEGEGEERRERALSQVAGRESEGEENYTRNHVCACACV